MNLDQYTIRQIVAALKVLGGGTVGTDHARLTKDELIAWGVDKHGADKLAKAMVDIGKEDSGWNGKTETGDVQSVKEAIVGRPVALPPATYVKAPPTAEKAAHDIGLLLADLTKHALDEESVRRIVAEMLPRIAPRKLEVSIGEKMLGVVDEHTHPVFEKVLKLLLGGAKVLMTGPAGTGKSHMAKQLAKALAAERFAAISGAAGVTEAQLLGRLLPLGEQGQFQYMPSPIMDTYEHGGLVFLDEFDAFDPNCLLVLNSAIANRGIHVESRRANALDTYVPQHDNTYILAAANTYGTGANAIYAGRNQLDAATLDRFYVVFVDYDTTFEDKLVQQVGSPDAHSMYNWVKKVRGKIHENKMRRVFGTRALQKSLIGLSVGLKPTEIQDDLLQGWNADERKLVGA